MLLNAILSALLNLLLLGGFPFLGYCLYHRVRSGRSFRESAQRAGLRLGPPRYLIYSLGIALAGVIALLLWHPPLDAYTRPGSPQASFVGLGQSGAAWLMALLYGFIQTGCAEELLFRGLIAGSLARRLSLTWANLVQALIFLLPHLAILRVMPELRNILPLVFLGGLLTGWLRFRSGSVLGPTLIHGALNTAICLEVAIRTAG
jgi:membrane protease YdiL (CAAX protease family)